MKTGSALLADDSGNVNRAWLSGVAADIAARRAAGRQTIVVSSGAIAIGSNMLGINRRRCRLEELQASAAAGQVHLVQAWQEALGAHGITVAQVLLTLGDTEDRRRFLNARETLEKLLEHNVVPVVNENDTVATEEIRYGDNDRLAARVAQMVMADGLLLLSDVDGFYTADPRLDAAATHIPDVRGITDAMLAMAGKPLSAVGSGGMATKLNAAAIAIHAGCSTIVMNGRTDRPITALAAGCRRTIFHARSTPAAARKQWLAGALELRGCLRLDAGAARALSQGKSLLPVGVVAVSGEFLRGDPVALLGPDGRELGRGLVAYGHEDAAKILRCRSSDMEASLGYRGRSVMVHRNDLVVFGAEEST
ncbi:MAG: glutamate 5-kinase [Woeseia sp.]